MDLPLTALGAILLLGLLTFVVAERTPLPRVTLLLLFGLAIGPDALGLIPGSLVDHFDRIAMLTLLMVGFLLGGKCSGSVIQQDRWQVLAISAAAAGCTALLVILGLSMLGLPTPVALLLGCIASATAPVAVVDVVEQVARGEGARRRFGDLLLSITALDDVWALVLFGAGLALATAGNGAGSPWAPLLWAFRDLGGGALLGLVIGVPAAFLTGRIRPGQPMLLEALGIVLLCGGLAQRLEVSYLIAAIVMGAVVANLAVHHEVPFHAIEDVEWPLMVLFFVLAGASTDLQALETIGPIGAAYVILRSLGKILGGRLGALWSGADSMTSGWVGVALLPQAGVAIGMALVAADQLAVAHQQLLSIVIGSTVVFELVGPLAVRLALSRFPTSQSGC